MAVPCCDGELRRKVKREWILFCSWSLRVQATIPRLWFSWAHCGVLSIEGFGISMGEETGGKRGAGRVPQGSTHPKGHEWLQSSFRFAPGSSVKLAHQWLSADHPSVPPVTEKEPLSGKDSASPSNCTVFPIIDILRRTQGVSIDPLQ